MANVIEIRVTGTGQNATRNHFQEIQREGQRAGQGLLREFRRAFGGMEDEARRGGDGARRELQRTFDGMADDAERAGEEMGEGLWRSADGRLRDARGRFAAAGRRAGESFSDGFEDGADEGGFGLGRMSGMVTGLIGRFKDMLAPAAAGGLAIATVGTTAAAAAPLMAPLVTGLVDIGSAALAAAPALIAAKTGIAILRFSFLELFKEESAALLALAPLAKGFQDAGKRGSEAAARGIKPLAEELRRVHQPTLNRYFVELGEAVNVAEKRFFTWGKSTEGVKSLKGILEPLSGMMKRLAPEVADVAISFAKMLGRVMGVSTAAGESGLSKVLDEVADRLDKITAKSVQGGFDDLAAKFRTVMDVGSTLVDWIEKIVAAYKMYTTEFRALADVISVAAIIFGGPVVAAVGAAGLIIRHFDEVKAAYESFKEAFASGETPEIFGGFLEHSEEIQENLGDIWEQIKELFQSVFEDVQEWVEENGDTIRQWGDDIGQVMEDMTASIETALEIITELWERFGPTLLEILGDLVSTLLKIWRGLWKQIRGVLDVFAGLLTGDWRRMWKGLKEIAEGFGEVFQAVMKGIWKLFLGGWKLVWAAVRDVVKNEFKRVRGMVEDALDFIVGKVKSFGGKVKSAFETAVGGIRKVWGGIKSATRDPVKWVIDVVYNKGVVPVWNFVAKIAGMGQLDRMRFEQGGVVDMTKGGTQPGYSPRDNRIGLFRDGEGVLVPETVQGLGGPNTIDALNRAGPRAKDVLMGGQWGSPRLQAFQFGGIVGRLKGMFDDGLDLLKGAPKLLMNKGITAWTKSLLGPALSGRPGGKGWWGQAIGTMPKQMANAFIGWVKDNLEQLFVGGGDFGKALQWGKTQDGKGYQWGGDGNPSWDCSGFMSALESVIRGESPHRRWSTHPFHGGAKNPMPGWYRDLTSNFRIGVTSAGVGHTAGTLMGTAVESSGSGGVQVGGGARGADHPMFQFRYGFRKGDNGLIAPPGMNAFVNATGAPEELRPVDQLPEVHVHLTIDNHGVIGSRIDLEDWLVKSLDSIKRQGRLDDLLARTGRT